VTTPSRPEGGLTYAAPVLVVKDLARTLAFYRERLGFEVEFSYEDFYASVWRDGCRIHLTCGTPAPRGDTSVPQHERLDVCLGVRGAEALAAGVVAAGLALAVPLRRMPYGVEFYVRDPDGYVLGFIEPA
jgi:catechol 2,3-dioxygenase-like lactoylglutathione lyase family enzyme